MLHPGACAERSEGGTRNDTTAIFFDSVLVFRNPNDRVAPDLPVFHFDHRFLGFFEGEDFDAEADVVLVSDFHELLGVVTGDMGKTGDAAFLPDEVEVIDDDGRHGDRAEH